MQYPKIAEYGQIKHAPFSRPTVLAQGINPRTGKTHRLWHGQKGYEPAGSMARWTDEYWSVLVMYDGASHGKRFNTLVKAQDYFWNTTR